MRRIIKGALHREKPDIGTGPAPDHDVVDALQPLSLGSESQAEGHTVVIVPFTVDAAAGEPPAALLVQLLVDTRRAKLNRGRLECRTVPAFDRGREGHLRCA